MMSDSVDFPLENRRLALLLARALRQADAERFFTVYDDIIPQDLPITQIEAIKESARELADLPQEEFREKEQIYISMNSANDPVVDSGLCSVSSNSSLHSQDYLTEESDISRKGIRRADSLSKDDTFASDGENGEEVTSRRYMGDTAPFGEPVCYDAVAASAMELISDRSASESITCPEPEPIPCNTQASVIETVEQELRLEKTAAATAHSEDDDDRCSHRNEQLSSEDIHHSGEGEATGDSSNGKKKKKRKKKKKKAKEETPSGLVSPAESASSDQAMYPKEFKYHGSPNRVSLVAVDGKYVTGVKVTGKYMVQRTMNQQVKVPVEDSTKGSGGNANTQEVDLGRQAYRTSKKENSIRDKPDNNIKGDVSDTARELTDDSVLNTKNGNKGISTDHDSIAVMPGKELSAENDSSESGLGSCEDKSSTSHSDDKEKRHDCPGLEPEFELEGLIVGSKRTEIGGNDKTYYCELEQPVEDSFELVENKRSKKRQQKMQSEPGAGETKFDARQKAKGSGARYRAKGSYMDSKSKPPFKDSAMYAFHHFAQLEGPANVDADQDSQHQPYARRQRPNSAKASDRRYEESVRNSHPPAIGIHISRSEPHLPLKNFEEKVVLSRGQLNGILLPQSLKQNFFPKETYSCTEALRFDSSSSNNEKTLTRSDSLPEIPVSQGDFSVSSSHSDVCSVDDTYASRLKKNLVSMPNAQLPTTESVAAAVVVASTAKENERSNSGNAAALDSVQTSCSDVALQPAGGAREKELPTALQPKPSDSADAIQFLSALKTEELNCKRADELKWNDGSRKATEKSNGRNSVKGTNKGIFFPLSDPGALGGDEDLGISFGTVVFKSGHLVIDAADGRDSIKGDKKTEVEREKHECAKCDDCRTFNHKDVARFLERAWKNITNDTGNEGTVVYYSEG